MLTTALPVAKRCGGRPDAAADRMVGRARPTPAPPTSQPGSSAPAYRGVSPTLSVVISVPAPNTRQPAAVIQETGIRRAASTPDTTAKTGTISGPGATPRPVRIAE